MSDDNATATVKVNIPFVEWIAHPMSMAIVGLSILCLAFIGYTFYRAYRKPEPTQTIGQAENVVTDNRTFGPTFGCATFSAMKVPEKK